MSSPSAKDSLVETNDRILVKVKERLASNDLTNFQLFSNKFAVWLRDSRAYYTQAKPKASSPPISFPRPFFSCASFDGFYR
jgi:hypothetical protein